MQTKIPEGFYRIPQDVHLVCSFGWKYQKVDLELVLKGPRVVYQEKKLGKAGFGERICGQRHPNTKTYSKELALFWGSG